MGSVLTGRKGQVTGAWNDDQFFGLTGQLVSLFAELLGMGSLTRDEEYGTRENRLNVRERVKFMNLTLLLSGWMRREVRRTALGREFTSRSAIKVVKLTLNGVGLGSLTKRKKSYVSAQDLN